MDCYDEVEIKQITVIKSGQTGFTQGFTNMIGKAMDLKPGPIGVFYPSEAGVKKFSKRKFNQMIRDTEPLVGKIEDARKRKGDNSVLEKEFPDGFISMAGLGSPNTAASQTLRDIYLDEVDRINQDVGGEGDIITLLKMRQENFEDSKLVLVSTPTEKDFSIIEANYLMSDQRKYYVPCPHCGRFQTLKFTQLKGWRIDKGVYRPELTFYECENRRCKAQLTERDKYSMVASGKWRKGNPEVADHAGFWINSLYSTLPKARWDLIVAQFVDYLKSGRDVLKLKTFTNLRLGETFEDQFAHHYDDSKIGDLLSRRENYGHVNPLDPKSEILIPKEVAVLTFGADVQEDRIEVKVKGWGLNEESWLIDYRVILGDTSTDVPFDKLDMYIGKNFKHKSGAQLRIVVGCIDSKFRTQQVLKFARNKKDLQVIPIHGIGTEGAPVFNQRSISNKSHPVGTFEAKKTLFARLGILENGPGKLHFPKYAGEFPVDEDYFKQLTAEKLITLKLKRVWKKFRTRNEALDIENYNLAAFHSLQFSEDNIREILKIIDVTANQGEEEEIKVEHSNYAKDGLYR